MTGRQHNYLIIRLQKTSQSKTCFYKRLIITRVRTKSSSRIDCLGSLGINSNMTVLKLDLKKLEKYLVLRHLRISKKVLAVFLDSRGLYLSKSKRKNLNNVS